MITNAKWLISNIEKPLGLALLISFHILICCVSLIYASLFKFPDYFTAALFHIFYEPGRLHIAVMVVAAFGLVSVLFAFARFSFGYFVGFYLFSMILSYLWMNCFSNLDYDHRLGGLSAAVSAVAFLLPALFVNSPIPRRYELSIKPFECFLGAIVLMAIATIAVGSFYNFRLVGIDAIYGFREQLNFPPLLGYAIGITSSTLLPFAFACFVARKNYWHAGAALLLLMFFYPITLSKITLITPAWLVAVALLSALVKARTAVVLSLLLPLLLGVLLVLSKTADKPLPLWEATRYFHTVNFRIIAVPAAAMDVYSDFFSKHDLTRFCQISILKPFIACPYQDQLSIVFERVYKLGNFNASLFATEGVASIGLHYAPIATFMCGLILALANRLSCGLPPRFILMSGAVFPQILLNVPMTVALVTHGGAVLFLLWYITPRQIFERNDDAD